MEIPFRSSERASLGVEWELQLVDLRAVVDSLLGELRDGLPPDCARGHAA